MKNLITTTRLVSGARYVSGALDYFREFDYAWDEVEAQVLKLETKQSYREPGNISYEEFVKGNYKKAMELLPEVRKEDETLYSKLRQNGIDFIRCRPVVLPLTHYLRWEVGCYNINAEYGEKIYFTEQLQYFDEFANHDFMVFDRFVGVVHDYSGDGELLGGWVLVDRDQVENLIAIFALIKAVSIGYTKFIARYQLDVAL